MQHWLHVPCDWRRSKLAESYELFWSPRSSFGQLCPRPTAEQLAAAYAVDYYTHGDGAPLTEQNGRRGLLSRLREHLAWRGDRGIDLSADHIGSLVAGAAPLRVCELGCGDGKLLGDLAALGFETIGIEPDPAARRVAAGRGLKVLDGVAEQLPAELSPESFDVLVMSHVLEHCSDPLVAMRNVATLLRDGGVAVIETPNNEALSLRQAAAAWPWLDVPRHLNFFTAASLRLACERASLEVLRIEYVGYCRNFQQPWLANEATIRTAFAAHGGKQVSPGQQALRSWQLLAATLLASPRRKYDSVRVIARRTSRASA
ncbi:MAG TPA: class I SAM-dependent methyltransferase [Pirellulales bacterium]|nr:class I SAM-dependent methyltransferase [Pirellulales bacterium]